MGGTFDDLSLMIGKYPKKVHCLGGVGNKRIKDAENILELQFPKSFREFLRRYGRLNYVGLEFYGLEQHLIDLTQSSCIKNTLLERKLKDFPKSHVVIYNTGWEGELFCLDTNNMRDCECPIVNWISGAKFVNQPNEVISNSYIDFLVDFVRQALNRHERRKS